MSARTQARRKGTEIFSIFGQCEAAAEGKLTRIEFKDIPSTVAFNDVGRPARFAVVVKAEHLAEFNRRCADLRA